MCGIFARRLNQIAPLENLRHVKRIRKKQLEGGIYLCNAYIYIYIYIYLFIYLLQCLQNIMVKCNWLDRENWVISHLMSSIWKWQSLGHHATWCSRACQFLPVECFYYKSGSSFSVLSISISMLVCNYFYWKITLYIYIYSTQV